jgi:murein DD-endopeptidase MepM/ murein hydrolase activator NlpD
MDFSGGTAVFDFRSVGVSRGVVCVEPEKRLVGTRFALSLLCLAVSAALLGTHDWARLPDSAREGGGGAVASESGGKPRDIVEEVGKVSRAGEFEAEKQTADLPGYSALKARLNALQKYQMLAYLGPLLLSRSEAPELLPGIRIAERLLWSDHRLFVEKLRRGEDVGGGLPLAFLGMPGSEMRDVDVWEGSGAVRKYGAKVERPLHRRPIVLPPPSFTTQRGRLPFPLAGKQEFFSVGKGTSYSESVLHSSGLFTAAPKGEPIRAIFRGTVIFAQRFKEYGQVMILDHGEHYCSLIAHADQLLKQVDDVVEGGEIIATVGKTGALKVPGLYFEIRHHGSPVDPHEWLRADTTSRE